MSMPQLRLKLSHQLNQYPEGTVVTFKEFCMVHATKASGKREGRNMKYGSPCKIGDRDCLWAAASKWMRDGRPELIALFTLPDEKLIAMDLRELSDRIKEGDIEGEVPTEVLA
jgi:hypothetical protein